MEKSYARESSRGRFSDEAAPQADEAWAGQRPLDGSPGSAGERDSRSSRWAAQASRTIRDSAPGPGSISVTQAFTHRAAATSISACRGQVVTRERAAHESVRDDGDRATGAGRGDAHRRPGIADARLEGRLRRQGPGDGASPVSSAGPSRGGAARADSSRGGRSTSRESLKNPCRDSGIYGNPLIYRGSNASNRARWGFFRPSLVCRGCARHGDRSTVRTPWRRVARWQGGWPARRGAGPAGEHDDPGNDAPVSGRPGQPGVPGPAPERPVARAPDLRRDLGFVDVAFVIDA